MRRATSSDIVMLIRSSDDVPSAWAYERFERTLGNKTSTASLCLLV